MIFLRFLGCLQLVHKSNGTLEAHLLGLLDDEHPEGVIDGVEAALGSVPMVGVECHKFSGVG